MSFPVEYKLLHPLARPLRPLSPGSAGYDLYACLDAPLSLRLGENAVLIPTGLAIYMADPGYAALILPRSGPGHRQGLVLGNGVGLVPSDSRQEWQVSALNRGPGDEIIIKPGDAIAQVVFVPVVHPTFNEVLQFGAG